MSTPETPDTPQSEPSREVTLSVPEHRAEQFQALARRVLAVWAYRDAYGQSGRGSRRHRGGRAFGRRAPGRDRHHRGCHAREDAPVTTAGGEEVDTV
jgi:hypothetical protein